MREAIDFIKDFSSTVDKSAYAGMVFGLGVTLLGLLTQYVYREISRAAKLILLLSGIGLFAITLSLAYWDYIDKKSKDRPSPQKIPMPNSVGPYLTPTQKTREMPQEEHAPPAAPSSNSDSQLIGLKPKAYIGTLPPKGDPSMFYWLTNWNGQTSVQGANVVIWQQDANRLELIDSRHIGYVAPGNSVRTDPFPSLFADGRVAVCLAYDLGAKKVAEVFFFESSGEKMRYPPLREMRVFHDSENSIDPQSTCDTLQNRASVVLSE